MDSSGLTQEMMNKANTNFVKTMRVICLKKCIPDYKTEDLNGGETNCIDRCVTKFFEANNSLQKLYSEDKMNPANN